MARDGRTVARGLVEEGGAVDHGLGMGEIARGRFLIRRWGPPVDVVEDGAVYVEDGQNRPPTTTRSSGAIIPVRQRWATARTFSCQAS